jgi:hypothetical protein
VAEASAPVDWHRVIASSGGIVQSTSLGHQNLRSLPASAVHGTRHGSPGSPTAPPASRTDWGPAGRLIRPRLADLVSPRARSGAAAAGPCRGSPGHVRQCPGDFRGRLLRRGGLWAGLVAGFYPRQRHAVWHGDWAVPRVNGTRPAVSGRLPRKTPEPRWLNPRARCRFLSSPPACRRAWGTGPSRGFPGHVRQCFRETSAEDSCAAVAHGPGSLQVSILATGIPATGILAVWHGLRGGCRARVFSRWASRIRSGHG